MTQALLKINRQTKPTMLYVGAEKTPVFMLDDFAEDVDGIVAHACLQENYSDWGGYYPGLQCNLPREHIVSVARSLESLF